MGTCYRDGGCGPYEMYSCSECPASKPEYRQKNIARPVKRIGDYYNLTERPWWSGRCPKCNEILRYTFGGSGDGYKQYCWRCGQLCDFEDKGEIK
jgi:hypothetical protein